MSLKALLMIFLLLISVQPGLAYTSFDDDEDDDDDDGAQVKFIGVIEKLPANGSLVGDWQVSGRIVRVTGSTKLEQERGAAVVGATVEVEGTEEPDRSVRAYEIEVKTGGGGSSSNYIEFYGVIEKLPANGSLVGDWQVSGRIVRVTGSTKLEQERGAAVVGATVEVEGTEEPDRSVRAYEIEVKTGGSGSPSNYIEFYGVIEALPSSGLIGEWTVSGKRVRVSADTQIKNYNGAPAVGKQVEVKGVVQSDSSILASSIEVKSTVPGTGYTQLYGVIEALPQTQGQIGDWRVAGKTVRVTSSTILDSELGAFSIGTFVEIEGELSEGGIIVASKIEAKQKGSTNGSPTFYGIVELLPSSSNLQGEWAVSGRTVHVDNKTKIIPKNSTPRIGSNVEIKGRQETDGSFTAKRIKVKS